MMRRKTIVASILILCALMINATADALTREQRLSDARTMLALFDNRYAPIEWKKTYMGISMQDLSAELLRAVGVESISDRDFYAAMAKFSGGLKDTHNWFVIPSSLFSKLGFVTDYVEGEVLIDEIDRDILPISIFPYSYGDQLVSIDGKPVSDVMAELGQYFGEGNELAKMRFVAKMLTRRSGAALPDVPTAGRASLEIFSRSRDAIELVDLEWKTQGLSLAPGGRSPSLPSISKSSPAIPGKVEKPSALEVLRWSAIDERRIDGAGIGRIKSFFPLWNTFVERTTYPLRSGIFLIDGKRIGFLRIPTWNVPVASKQREWIDFFEREIPYLDSQTDALLIDQTNNGGGKICLGEEVASFLITEPISINYFQMRANRMALGWYEEDLKSCVADGNSDCEILRGIVAEMRRAIAAGDLLTAPISICATSNKIYPHKSRDGKYTVYTKPIVMLVNEWSISTADMTPAFLQDSGRVVIFGGRTCGAGGNVQTIGPIGYSDFQISQTESLTVRPREITAPNGMKTRYLENVGVIPDVEYPITKEEFLNGYAGYKKAIETTLLSLIGH